MLEYYNTNLYKYLIKLKNNASSFLHKYVTKYTTINTINIDRKYIHRVVNSIHNSAGIELKSIKNGTVLYDRIYNANIIKTSSDDNVVKIENTVRYNYPNKKGYITVLLLSGLRRITYTLYNGTNVIDSGYCNTHLIIDNDNTTEVIFSNVIDDTYIKRVNVFKYDILNDFEIAYNITPNSKISQYSNIKINHNFNRLTNESTIINKELKIDKTVVKNTITGNTIPYKGVVYTGVLESRAGNNAESFFDRNGLYIKRILSTQETDVKHELSETMVAYRSDDINQPIIIESNGYYTIEDNSTYSIVTGFDLSYRPNRTTIIISVTVQRDNKRTSIAIEINTKQGKGYILFNSNNVSGARYVTTLGLSSTSREPQKVRVVMMFKYRPELADLLQHMNVDNDFDIFIKNTTAPIPRTSYQIVDDVEGSRVITLYSGTNTTADSNKYVIGINRKFVYNIEYNRRYIMLPNFNRKVTLKNKVNIDNRDYNIGDVYEIKKNTIMLVYHNIDYQPSDVFGIVINSSIVNYVSHIYDTVNNRTNNNDILYDSKKVVDSRSGIAGASLPTVTLTSTSYGYNVNKKEVKLKSNDSKLSYIDRIEHE